MQIYVNLCLVLLAWWSGPGQASAQRKSAPVFISKEITRVSIHAHYAYQFAAMDSAGDALTYSVPVLPAWLSYSSADRTLSGKPAKAGQYPVVISVSDNNSTTYQRFVLTVFDSNTINILPLGNSITNGTDKYNSYRRSLWWMLREANCNFDFIGSWSRHHMGGEVPNPDFDMDHEGHSGWNCEHIFHPPDWDAHRGNIGQWLQEYSPDIVLVELGTNDVFQCRSAEDVLKNFDELISVLRAKNKNVKVLVATVLPLGKEWGPKKLCGDDESYDERLKKLNEAMKVFVAKVHSDQSPVVLVDQFSGIDPEQHMYDDIHPNEVGEALIARKWFRAMERYFIGN